MNMKRFNFSSRAVIAQDPTLRVDQIKLPYKTLAIILQQKIINILGRIYHITPSQAYNIWSKGLAKYDEEIATIIQSIINSTEQGIPFLINRNPTISYGSILQSYCVGINNNYTMSIPLQILKPLAADQLKRRFNVEVPFYSDVDRINAFNCWEIIML